VGIPGCLHFGINGMAASLVLAQSANLAVLIAFCSVRLNMPSRLFWAFDPASLRCLMVAVESILKSLRLHDDV
jgi:hypothetical protein